MGQYHIPINLTKREFINPHKLGSGLKLLEQAWTQPGTATSLILLLGVSTGPDGRGGGDPRSGHPRIGSWGGDRIAIVGDYAELEDLPVEDQADMLYTLTHSPEDIEGQAQHWEKLAEERLYGEDEKWREMAARVRTMEPLTDISDEVIEMLESLEEGHFEKGQGFPRWKSIWDDEPATSLRPDMAIYAAPEGKGS